MRPINALLGKKITGMQVSDDDAYLRFDTDAGRVLFFADADCCSETWFADITGVDALLGGRVLEVDEVDIGVVHDDRGRQDEDVAYGVKLRTDKGYADIVFRNSSNGYYGGGLRLITDYLDWPVPTDDTFTPITADWSAS